MPAQAPAVKAVQMPWQKPGIGAWLASRQGTHFSKVNELVKDFVTDNESEAKAKEKGTKDDSDVSMDAEATGAPVPTATEQKERATAQAMLDMLDPTADAALVACLKAKLASLPQVTEPAASVSESQADRDAAKAHNLLADTRQAWKANQAALNKAITDVKAVIEARNADLVKLQAELAAGQALFDQFVRATEEALDSLSKSSSTTGTNPTPAPAPAPAAANQETLQTFAAECTSFITDINLGAVTHLDMSPITVQDQEAAKKVLALAVHHLAAKRGHAAAASQPVPQGNVA